MRPSPHPASRRRAIGASIAALAVAVLSLTGCTSGPTPPAGSDDPASTDAFPVTIEHVYGTTTIPEKPERVVTLGWGSQDAVAALGVVPVAITDFTWGTVDTYLPWFADEVKELGGALPEIVTALDSGEYDFEQILGLAPDVIIARHSGVTEEEYQRLSEIAPTIAYQKTAWESDWQDVQLTVGKALGLEPEAQKIVDDTNAVIARHAAAHPEFADVTFAYGWAWVDGDPEIGIYTQGDARERLIQQLGFRSSPTVVERSKSADEFYFGVSLEEVDTIDADLYIAWANDDAEWDAMLANPLIGSWPTLADGKYYVMTEQDLSWASSQPSALAIPWSLDIIVPALAEIVAE